MGFGFTCCCGTHPPPPCVTNSRITISVFGVCGGYFAASVSITGPASFAGTTGATGVYVVATPYAGTYYFSVSAPGYKTKTGSFKVTCGFNVSASATLALADGYTCSNSCCTDTGPPPHPIVVYPSNLYFNDGIGTVTLTGDGTGEFQGTATRVATSALKVDTCSSPANVNVTLHFQAFCNWYSGVTQRGFAIFVSYYPARNLVSGCGNTNCNGFINIFGQGVGTLCTTEDLTCPNCEVGFEAPDATSTCSPFIVNATGSTTMTIGTTPNASQFEKVYGSTGGVVTVGGTLTS